MVHDIVQIESRDVLFKPRENGDGGQVVNSYKVQNPLVIYGYSIYLRYFSEYKNCFDGSAAGIAGEWIVHNVAYDLSFVPSKLGFLKKQNDQAKDADFGRNIYDDGRWYVELFSSGVEFLLNPYAYRYDLYQHIRKVLGGTHA